MFRAGLLARHNDQPRQNTQAACYFKPTIHIVIFILSPAQHYHHISQPQPYIVLHVAQLYIYWQHPYSSVSYIGTIIALHQPGITVQG